MKKLSPTFRYKIDRGAIITQTDVCCETRDISVEHLQISQIEEHTWLEGEQPRHECLPSPEDHFQIIKNFNSEDKRPRQQRPHRKSFREQRRTRDQLLQQRQQRELRLQYAINDEAETTPKLLHNLVNEKEGGSKLEEYHDNNTNKVSSECISSGGVDGRGGDADVASIGTSIISSTQIQHREQPYSLMAALKLPKQQDEQEQRLHLVKLQTKRTQSSCQHSIIAISFLCLYILQQLASHIYNTDNEYLLREDQHRQQPRQASAWHARVDYHKSPDVYDSRGGILLFAFASEVSPVDFGVNESPDSNDQRLGASGNRFDELLEREFRLEDSREPVRPLDLIKQKHSTIADRTRTPTVATTNNIDDDIVSGKQINDEPSLASTPRTPGTDHKRHHQQDKHKHHHPHHPHHHQNHYQHHQHRKKYHHQQQHRLDSATSPTSDRIRRHNTNNNYNNDYSDDSSGGGGSGGGSGSGGYFDASSQNAADRPVVATQKGLIRGITRKSVTGKYVDAFLGIPFAQPPTGRYRFRHPRPINPWPGVRDASKLSNSCYQVNDTFFGATFMGTSVWNANTPLNEDCLYLNVWTPFGVANTTVSSTTSTSTSTSTSMKNNNNKQHNNYHHSSPLQGEHESSQAATGGRTTSSITGGGGGSKPLKRAVLVWIFGGGFYSGTSSLALYDGSALASEEDIIVVSMNYRVSALGFLYFGRPDAPGNSGLFDQLLALQWINDNIDQFGGDPERVTLFGESAGAVSIAFHLLSPLSRNLFNQAILQSGGPTCPWGHMELHEIISNGLQLASIINCPSNHTDLDSVVECLLKADPMTLVSQEVGQTRNVLNFPFVPVVDGSFLIEPPAESLAKANFKQARILLGSNYDEANSFLIYWPQFSQCPSSSSSASSSSSSSSSQPSTTLAPSDSVNGSPPSTMDGQNSDGINGAMTHADVDSATLLMSELRDEAQPMADSEERQLQIKSLDLLGPSGRQSSSHAKASMPAVSGQHHQLNNDRQQLKRQGEVGTASSHHQQQQQLQQQDDSSNSCKPIELLSLSRDDFFQVLREGLNPYAEHPIGKEAIIFEYSNWNNPQDPVSNYDAIDKIVGDYNFLCHVNEFGQRYAEAGNGVYMYYFKQHSSISPWPKWMGVLHGDEIYFIFGEPLNQLYNYTSKEVELSRRMMKYWANFAKFGDPTKTGDNSSMQEKWPEYGDKKQYFELHSDYIRIGRGPRAKQCAFWSDYLPKLIQSFDKGGQCMAPGKGHNFILNHPFSSAGQLDFGFSRGGSPYHQQHLSLLNSIPSGLLISLLVILVLSAIGAATYMFCFRHSSATWKLKWPLGSSSASGAGNNSGTGGAGSNRGGGGGGGGGGDPSN